MALCKINTYANLIRNSRQFTILYKDLTNRSNFKYSNPYLIGSQRWLFHESHRKGGYDTEHKISNWEHMKNGFKELKEELNLFKQEVIDLIETDPLLIARPGKATHTFILPI